MGNEFRRQIRGYIDEDVHTRWRRLMCTYNRAGAAAKDKRITRRRERAQGRGVTRNAWKEEQ